jgi:hypothetical protein
VHTVQNYACVHISEKKVYGFAFYKYGSAVLHLSIMVFFEEMMFFGLKPIDVLAA